jgi:steroid 5-alpha reductase family enzyme
MNNNFINFLISFLTFSICVFIANLTGIQNITYAVLFIFLIHLLIFVPSYYFQTEKFFDLTGTISYVSSVFFIFFKTNTVDSINLGSLALSTFIIIWSLRLGTFLFLRIKKAGKDRRFNEIKKSFSWFFMTFSLSGMWVTICSICALTGIANGIIFSSTTIIGIIIFTIGFTIEIIADSQKTKFRAMDDNKDKFISIGLWKYSRHPNYLGEIILWLGISLISFSSLEGLQYITLISPIFTYLLLVNVSGINLLEKSGEKKWGHLDSYKSYKENTPRLIGFL